MSLRLCVVFVLCTVACLRVCCTVCNGKMCTRSVFKRQTPNVAHIEMGGGIVSSRTKLGMSLMGETQCTVNIPTSLCPVTRQNRTFTGIATVCADYFQVFQRMTVM